MHETLASLSVGLVEQVVTRVRGFEAEPLTVLVTHWWEYFRNNQSDDALIEVLHQIARYLACQPSVEVVSFNDVAAGKVPLN